MNTETPRAEAVASKNQHAGAFPPVTGSDLPREFREAVACLGETENLAEWAKLRRCDCGSDSVGLPRWGCCALECTHCGRWVDRLNWLDALDEWDRCLPASVPPGVPVLDLDPEAPDTRDQNTTVSNPGHQPTL